MKPWGHCVSAVGIALAMCAGTAWGQTPAGTAFTYQGSLTDGGTPANGPYDFEFQLFADAAATQKIGDTVWAPDNLEVTNGLFTADIDFGAGAFTGEARWLLVGVRRGDEGGGFTQLYPPQELTPAPYALFALDGPGGGGDAWLLGGNTGTDPLTDFLGTTDNVAFEIRVNDQRALRAEPDTSIALSPNLIGGWSGNWVEAGVRGGTISGGGTADNGTGTPFPNIVLDHWGTIGGGVGNQAGDVNGDPNSDRGATVAGGWFNVASGMLSSIGGGSDHEATGRGTFIGGGSNNRATGDFSTVGGGKWNLTMAGATVAGGLGNLAEGLYSTVPGGKDNSAGGRFSFAAGNNASVRTAQEVGGGDQHGDEGTFVWSDFLTSDAATHHFFSQAPGEFAVRCRGGARFITAVDEDYQSPTYGDPTDGVWITADGEVGIGTNGPQARLHVGGTAGVDGIMFPDGTLQTSAADASHDHDDRYYSKAYVDALEARIAALESLLAQPEICDDAFDNDFDGFFDCDDSDCDGHAACGGAETICDDSLDNDADGPVDCADSDCDGMAGVGGTCTSGSEPICDDWFDNDADGQVDCADPDCDGIAVFGTTCTFGAETICDDGFDNDGDGQIDCDDGDCYVGGGETDCTDYIDNDCDGLTDCEEASCDAVQRECSRANAYGTCYGVETCEYPDGYMNCSALTPEPETGVARCADGVDNECDGFTDCQDVDCDGTNVGPGTCSYGVEIVCDDSFDDDGDGQTDCADPDCAGDPACGG